MTYSATKFEVATSNGLGGDTFTRNVTDAHPHGRTTDRLWYEINIPFFSKEKSGYNYKIYTEGRNPVVGVGGAISKSVGMYQQQGSTMKF